LIVDKEQNHFILINAGRLPNFFKYEVIAHVQIKNGKIFILEETIDPGMFMRLEDRGIPEKDILPVYLPDFELEEELALA
ncbi:MAG: element excision factor XisI family protein, partial [Planctomycetota bacterium]